MQNICLFTYLQLQYLLIVDVQWFAYYTVEKWHYGFYWGSKR